MHRKFENVGKQIGNKTQRALTKHMPKTFRPVVSWLSCFVFRNKTDIQKTVITRTTSVAHTMIAKFYSNKPPKL